MVVCNGFGKMGDELGVSPAKVYIENFTLEMQSSHSIFIFNDIFFILFSLHKLKKIILEILILPSSQKPFRSRWAGQLSFQVVFNTIAEAENVLWNALNFTCQTQIWQYCWKLWSFDQGSSLSFMSFFSFSVQLVHDKSSQKFKYFNVEITDIMSNPVGKFISGDYICRDGTMVTHSPRMPRNANTRIFTWMPPNTDMGTLFIR